VSKWRREALLEGAKAEKTPQEKCSCVDRGVNPNNMHQALLMKMKNLLLV
jgi:hypothetical protein